MVTMVNNAQVESALRQARRERKRGHHRKEMLLLRKAAFTADESPGLWNRYAFSCLRGGHPEEAEKAFAQAVWLDRHHGNVRRSEITRVLAQRAMAGEVIFVH